MSIKKPLNNTLESTITLGFWKGRERIKSVKFKFIVQIISLHKFQYPVYPSRIPKPYYIPIKFKEPLCLSLSLSLKNTVSKRFQKYKSKTIQQNFSQHCFHGFPLTKKKSNPTTTHKSWQNHSVQHPITQPMSSYNQNCQKLW